MLERAPSSDQVSKSVWEVSKAHCLPVIPACLSAFAVQLLSALTVTPLMYSGNCLSFLSFKFLLSAFPSWHFFWGSWLVRLTNPNSITNLGSDLPKETVKTDWSASVWLWTGIYWMQKGNAFPKNLLYMSLFLVHDRASMMNYPLPAFAWFFSSRLRQLALFSETQYRKYGCGIKHFLLQLWSLEAITTARRIKRVGTGQLLE